MRARYARAVVTARYAVVAFWIVAAVVATIQLPAISDAQVGALGDLVPTHAQAVEVELRSKQDFGFPLLSRTLVVQRNPEGLSARAVARSARRIVALNRHRYPELRSIAGALGFSNLLGRPPFSREHSTTAITYLFFPADIGPVGRAGLTQLLIERHMSKPTDHVVGATGAVQARHEEASIVSDALPLIESLTVLLVVVAVGLHFRSPGAPAVALVAVGASYLVAIRLIAWVGRLADISVPSEVQPVIVALLFGIVTDYTIFFLSRFRARLGNGEDRLSAARAVTAELAPVVLAAGLAVAGASAGLVVAQLGFFRAFGPGMAMAVVIALAVVLTAVPAMLAMAGSAVFWPHRPKRTRRERRHRLLRLATRRPLPTVIACTLALLGLAVGVLHMRLANPLIRGLPASSETREAYVAATRGFAPGILAPTVLVLQSDGLGHNRSGLSRLQRLLAHQPGVAAVAGPASIPVRVALGAALSRRGNAVRYVIILDADPLSNRAIVALRRLRTRLSGLLERAGVRASPVGFAGDTALLAEIVDATHEDLGRVAPVVAAIVFLILAVFLRAVIAPLYLLAASALALLATLGLTTLVFSDLLGYGELTYFVPFAATVLLVALGSDYNVFVVGRIWEEARSRPLHLAVAEGGARAATPVTVAGVVLALSFALTALVDLRPFRELAFTMTIGLLLDAFLVRTVLVPALVALVGPHSGWPGKRLCSRSRGGGRPA